MKQQQKTHRIGYYMSQHKISKLPWAEICRIADERGMELVSIDIDKDIAAQGPFDMVIYKVTDELVRASTDDIQKRRIENLEQYLSASPAVIDAEPLKRQRDIIDREGISHLLNSVEQQLSSHLSVRCPRFVIINQEVPDYTDVLKAHDVHFPAMVKTVQACGTVASHEMGIVFEEKALHSFTLPLLVQEYYNHDSVVFKVFAAHDSVQVVRRPSLRNVDPSENKSLLFNSQQPLPADLFDKSIDVQDKNRLADPPKEALAQITASLREQLGLSLLGFDMVTNKDTGKHGIIDVNYFPGYSGMPNFPTLFVDFLQHKLLAHCSN